MDALERIQARHLIIQRRLKFEAIMPRAFAAIPASALSKEEAPFDEQCDKPQRRARRRACGKPSDPKRFSLPFPSLVVALAGQGKVD